MTDVVWVSLPIRFHLRKEISLVDSLRLTDCALDRISFLTIDLAVSSIKTIQTLSNSFDGLVLGCIRLTQGFYCLPFKIGQ